MELELGGPVWHASASFLSQSLAWQFALAALRGVGDAQLGEWREVGDRAVHVRRRLTDDERALAGGLKVRDIRGTGEEALRFETLIAEAPQLMRVLPYLARFA
jgi:hypothetical protein